MLWLNKVLSLLPLKVPNFSLMRLLSWVLPDKFRVVYEVGVLRRRGGPATAQVWEIVPYSFDVNWYQTDKADGLSPSSEESGNSK